MAPIFRQKRLTNAASKTNAIASTVAAILLPSSNGASYHTAPNAHTAQATTTTAAPALSSQDPTRLIQRERVGEVTVMQRRERSRPAIVARRSASWEARYFSFPQ